MRTTQERLLNWVARRNPTVLAGVRALRRLMFDRSADRGAECESLYPDQAALAPFAEINTALPAEMLAEFNEIERVLAGVPAGVAAGRRWLMNHPLAELASQAAELNIVYTSGKVGTKTIVATLQAHPSFQSTVRHAHFLSPTGLTFLETLIRRCAARAVAADTWRDIYLRGRWMRVLIAINRALRASGRSVRKPFVIAGVREPLALHLSFCFESLWMYADTPAFLTADFVRKRLHDDAWHHHCNNWFSNDLLEMFGVDVFAWPFPRDQGWEIYENESARLLLIRQENLTRLPDALGALSGLPPQTFNVVTTNTAAGKAYASLYERVKSTLRLPRCDLNAIYHLPYVEHFYSADEIARFKDRWISSAPEA